jgi:NAD+ diphosphatase
VIMLVEHDGHVLLGRRIGWSEARFSILAGFVSPGETPEEAVAREVMEESGIFVHSPRYVASQPWPFPSSLMLGFTARARDDDAVPVADGVELAEASWFTRDELREQAADGAILLPPTVSIARRLIEHWLGGELVDARSRR